MPTADPAQENFGTTLSLGGRVDVFPETPLPEFNSAGGPAFAARLRGDTRSDLMAVVCTTGLPARFDLVNAMRTIDNPGVLRLRESGVMFWPNQNAHYYALAYDRPQAPRYRLSLDDTFPAMSEDAINHHFVQPMISALAEFQRTGIVHGAIRTTNIYWRDGGISGPQLGECLSAPSGIGQPVLFETIERSMSIPIGRGPGQHVDDCYAFGVMLALLVLGENPLRGMDDAAIIQAKLDRGTFNALTGQRRLASSHIELLRGLLTDDSHQRWTASDLEQWLAGRRLTPKNSDAGRRASRHIALAGKEYWQVRPLAAALAANPDDAVKLIEGGSLEKWLTRSLGDEGRAEDVSTAVEQTKENGRTAHYEQQLVARICMALDPAAPIRYRGVAVMPGGIAAMLAEAMITGANTQILSEIISSQFVSFWVNLQKDVKTELVPLAQQLERMRGIIEKTTFGNGVERAAYDLNPTLPCLSPMLKGQYVTTAKQMLAALERVAAQPNRPSEPMDRHIAAFLIVRDKRSESLFSAMSPQEQPSRRGVAMLTLYSELQYRHGPDQVPALAAWLMPLLEPGIRRFLSKPFQEKVRKEAKAAVDSGNLGNLLKIVDDPKRIEHDAQDFLMARKMFHDIQREIATLEEKLAQRERVVQAVGRPVAATIASVLALTFMAFTIIRAVLHHIGI